MAKAIVQAYPQDGTVAVVDVNLKRTLRSRRVQDGTAEEAKTRLCPNDNMILITKDVAGYAVEAIWTSAGAMLLESGDMETSYDMIFSRAAAAWKAVSTRRNDIDG